jgi:hypothetical protein
LSNITFCGILYIMVLDPETQQAFTSEVWGSISQDVSSDVLLLPGHRGFGAEELPHGEHMSEGDEIALVATLPMLSFTRLANVDVEAFVDTYEALPHAILKVGRGAILAVTVDPLSRRGSLKPTQKPQGLNVISVTYEGFHQVYPDSDLYVNIGRDSLKRLQGFEDTQVSNRHASIGWGVGNRTSVHNTSRNGTYIAASRGAVQTLNDLTD